MFRNPYADGLIILVIVLLFFGPKRLPSLARSLGESAKEFRNSIGGHSSDDEAERPEITQATAAPAAPPAPAAEPTTASAAASPPSPPADSAS